MFKIFRKSDQKIIRDVKTDLSWDPRVRPERIMVDSIDGIVTLRGNVRHYFEKRTAEAACFRVSGVRAVADELEVDLLGIYKINDEDVAKAAAMSLE